MWQRIFDPAYMPEWWWWTSTVLTDAIIYGLGILIALGVD